MKTRIILALGVPGLAVLLACAIVGAANLNTSAASQGNKDLSMFATNTAVSHLRPEREAITCEMTYDYSGTEAHISTCVGGARTYDSYGKVSGDFLIVIKDITLDGLAWSEANLNKFLSDKSRLDAVIDAQNHNIDTYLGLAEGKNDANWNVNYSENDAYISSIRDFAASLGTGRITNIYELLTSLRVLQISPPIMNFSMSELEKDFSVVTL